jgi:hypothetical protein
MKVLCQGKQVVVGSILRQLFVCNSFHLDQNFEKRQFNLQTCVVILKIDFVGRHMRKKEMGKKVSTQLKSCYNKKVLFLGNNDVGRKKSRPCSWSLHHGR